MTTAAFGRMVPPVVETPGSPDALERLAFAFHDAGRLSEAARWFRRSLALAADRPRAELGLGVVAYGAGNRLTARKHYRRALAMAPGQVEAANNVGVAMLELGAPTDASRWFKRGTCLQPTWFPPYGNLANVLRTQGWLERAGRASRQGLALAPQAALVQSNLALIEQVTLRQRDADLRLQRALSIGRHAAIHSNLVFARTYRPDVDERQLFATVRSWSAHDASPSRPRPRDPDPDRRLRIGYLSSDLRSHPVGWNLIGLIENHDPRSVEILGYSAEPAVDGLAERFRAAFAGGWREVAHLDDRAIAAQIAADGIDILVVAAGHTSGNRPGVAFHRPAVIQASMHDLTSTGLETMDYWFTDADLSPPDSPELFTETLVRLPTFYLHTAPSLRDNTPPPRDDQAPVVFGSTNNPAKLSEEVLALWARVLAAVPGSRLSFRYFEHFAHEDGRAPFKACLARLGIGGDRLDFATGRRERDDQLDHLGSIDVILDPFPFNGATTTFEALWMGVPVVTLIGRRFLGRVGAAHLRQVGLGDLVAATLDDYVRIASALARDPARRATLRASLRDRLRRSRLCDPVRYARSIETAYRLMWRAHCAGRRWDGSLPADAEL